MSRAPSTAKTRARHAFIHSHGDDDAGRRRRRRRRWWSCHSPSHSPSNSHDAIADDVAIDARGFECVGVASCAGVTRERGPSDNDDAFDAFDDDAFDDDGDDEGARHTT